MMDTRIVYRVTKIVVIHLNAKYGRISNSLSSKQCRKPLQILFCYNAQNNQ